MMQLPWIFLIFKLSFFLARLQASRKQEPYPHDFSCFMQHAAQQLILNHILTKNLLIPVCFLLLLIVQDRTYQKRGAPELIELSRDEGSSVLTGSL